MTNPVVHFEIIGKNPAALRTFYHHLFGWNADTSGPVNAQISDSDDYGFIPPPSPNTIAGRIGGGAAFAPHTLFYVGVADVAASFDRAIAQGATAVLDPLHSPTGALTVAQFRDPEGNLIGIAGPGPSTHQSMVSSKD